MEEKSGLKNKLHQSEQWLRMLIDNTEDYAIFAVDTEGRIATWNTGAEHLFGFEQAEMLGKEFSSIFTPEDVQRRVPQEEIERAQHEGYCPDVRWHKRKDGSRLFVSGSVRPLKDKEGKAHGFLIQPFA